MTRHWVTAIVLAEEALGSAVGDYVAAGRMDRVAIDGAIKWSLDACAL